jgi:hypothetical protein
MNAEELIQEVTTTQPAIRIAQFLPQVLSLSPSISQFISTIPIYNNPSLLSHLLSPEMSASASPAQNIIEVSPILDSENLP